MTEWSSRRTSAWTAVPVDHRPRRRASALGALIGALPGLPDRLRRHPVVHRHARRPARLARAVVLHLRRRDRSRPGRQVFRLLGGGPAGSLGGLAELGPRRRRLHRGRRRCSSTAAGSASGSASRCGRCGPRSRSASLGCAAVIGVVAFANAYKWPQGLVDASSPQDTAFIVPPGGLERASRCPILIVIGVTLVDDLHRHPPAVRPRRLRLGGNPEAAELAGINTRWTIMKTFILMGVLCGDRRGDRLGPAERRRRSTSAQGYELYVIAAAVIGGTSFAGGIGTIPGAVLGALVMQALAYGLSFIGVDSPIQNIVAGIVLVVAVGFDTWNRRRRGWPTTAERASDARPSPSARRSSRCATSTSPSAASTPSTTSRSICTPGEVIGLVGGNGAGKSTLMRALSGAHPADSGEILHRRQAA